jgi:hypothetical protein
MTELRAVEADPFDPGPPASFGAIFADVPAPPDRDAFWADWGPVFYRGRLDGSARLLCIASDPGATERIAGRTLVGDAGQRVQGFLRKLGLTSSYLCLNAFPYALMPSRSEDGPKLLAKPTQREWRNRLYDDAAHAELAAIVAFGVNAREALSLWDGRPDVKTVAVPHPTSRDEQRLLSAWRQAVTQLRPLVARDPDGDAGEANYGDAFTEGDYAPIPRLDLPFGVPSFLGDDAWARRRQPPLRASVSRPPHDDRHTLIWTAPKAGER